MPQAMPVAEIFGTQSSAFGGPQNQSVIFPSEEPVGIRLYLFEDHHCQAEQR